MAISLSKLRANLYEIVDAVIETGVPVEVERHGARVLIVSERPAGKLARLRKRDILRGDPEDIVHIDWSAGYAVTDALLVAERLNGRNTAFQRRGIRQPRTLVA